MSGWKWPDNSAPAAAGGRMVAGTSQSSGWPLVMAVLSSPEDSIIDTENNHGLRAGDAFRFSGLGSNTANHYLKASLAGDVDANIIRTEVHGSTGDADYSPAPHGFTVNHLVRFAAGLSGGAGLAPQTTYRVNSVPSPTTFTVELEDTPGTVDFTTDIVSGFVFGISEIENERYYVLGNANLLDRSFQCSLTDGGAPAAFGAVIYQAELGIGDSTIFATGDDARLATMMAGYDDREAQIRSLLNVTDVSIGLKAASAAAGTSITCTGHGLVVDDKLVFTTKVGGWNIRLGQTYWVKTAADANTITIAETLGGDAITIGAETLTSAKLRKLPISLTISNVANSTWHPRILSYWLYPTQNNNHHGAFIGAPTQPMLQAVKDRGAVSMLHWTWADTTESVAANRSVIPNSAILAGTWDSVITAMGSAIQTFGFPVIVRFMWEQNPGKFWFPWNVGDGSASGGNRAHYRVQTQMAVRTKQTPDAVGISVSVPDPAFGNRHYATVTTRFPHGIPLAAQVHFSGMNRLTGSGHPQDPPDQNNVRRGFNAIAANPITETTFRIQKVITEAAVGGNTEHAIFTGNTPANHKSAWQYITRKLRQATGGVAPYTVTTNARVFWCPLGYDRGALNVGPQMRAYYPGNDWVDYIGWDEYQRDDVKASVRIKATRPNTNEIQFGMYKGDGTWNVYDFARGTRIRVVRLASGSASPLTVGEDYFLIPTTADHKWHRLVRKQNDNESAQVNITTGVNGSPGANTVQYLRPVSETLAYMVRGMRVMTGVGENGRSPVPIVIGELGYWTTYRPGMSLPDGDAEDAALRYAGGGPAGFETDAEDWNATELALAEDAEPPSWRALWIKSAYQSLNGKLWSDVAGVAYFDFNVWLREKPWNWRLDSPPSALLLYARQLNQNNMRGRIV